MLSIYTLKSAREASKYYQNDNYYAKEGMDTYSEWLGKGSEKLNLKGPISLDQFQTVLEGHLPNGVDMIKTKQGAHHRPGYDLTFSAPKSVSILGIVGGDERVIAAHREAVKTVLTLIENTYGAYRAKENGVVRIEKTNNLTVAAFEHTDSRALDPNLHTHCIVMNLTERGDGAWRTLYGDDLYNFKILIGMHYRSILAEKLMALGFQLEQTSQKGTFELEGFEQKLIDQFSKRRGQIKERLESMGLSGGKAATIANFDTRANKKSVDTDQIRAVWEQDLKNCDHSLEWLHEYSKTSINRGPLQCPSPEITAQKSTMAAIHHLSEWKSVFKLKEVINIAKGMSIMPCRDSDLLKAIELKIETSELLYVGEGLLTTQQARDLEIDNVTKMRQGMKKVRPILGDLSASYVTYLKLEDPYQKKALKLMMTTYDRQVLISSASKSALYNVLSVFNEVCVDQRFYPILLTQAEANVDKLMKATGTQRVKTIEGFLSACEFRSAKTQHKPSGFMKSHDARQVWIVDGDISARQMNQLQTWSKHFGTRLIWTKFTHKAVPALEALKKHGIQQCTIEGAKANIKPLIKYLSKTHCQSVPNSSDRIVMAAQAFVENTHQQLVTTLRSDWHGVTDQIRVLLKQKGQLIGESCRFEIHQALNLSFEQKRLPHCYQLGDRIRFNQDNPITGVTEGSYWTVEAIDFKEGTLRLIGIDGKSLDWKPSQSDLRRIEVFRREQREIMQGDTLTWTRTLKREDDKTLNRIKGQKAIVLSIRDNQIAVQLQNGKTALIDTTQIHQSHWDYGYAEMIHKVHLGHAVETICLMNSRIVNSTIIEKLNACVVDNKLKIIVDDLESLKDKVIANHSGTHFSLEKAVTRYQRTEALTHQEGLVNLSSFPKLYEDMARIIESQSSLQSTEVSNKVVMADLKFPEQASETQINLVYKAVDEICAKRKERESIFSLSEAQQDAFLLTGLSVSKDMIDAGFSKAMQDGLLITVGMRKNSQGLSETMVTTQDTLLMEKGCIQIMQKGQAKRIPIMPNTHPSLQVVLQHEQLTDGQKRAIQLVLTTNDSVIGVQGVAGSGKTTMLKEVNRLCHESGIKLIGISNTASAKNRLIDASKGFGDLSIEAMTTQKFLNKAEDLLKHHPALVKTEYGTNTVLVLDEASLTSTKEMFTLLNITEKLGSSLLLVGDVKQMGSFGAGKPYYHLLGQGMQSVAMTENVRFKDPQTLSIMQDLYAVRLEDAMDKLLSRVMEIPDKQERLMMMAKTYLKLSSTEQAQTLIITPLNEDRQFVNMAIREELKSRELLKGPEVQTYNLLQKDCPQAEKGQIYAYETGDVIRFGATNRRLGIASGDYAKVMGREISTHTLTLEDPHGRVFHWSPKRDMFWDGSIEIYRSEARSLMVGERIRWKHNDSERGLFNGDLAEIQKVQGIEVEIVFKDGRQMLLNLKDYANQHWDYAYAVTLPVAQGHDVPLTLGHCESPKPYSKKTAELRVGDSIVLPKKDHPNSKDSEMHTLLVRVKKIDANTLQIQDRSNQLYEINLRDRQQQTWDYYPPFQDRKSQELPKTSSLNGFLVEATRGDNFMMFVDNLDYFRQTLEANQSLKESAIEHFIPNWQQIQKTVNDMTANISGKAKPNPIELIKKQNFQPLKSKKGAFIDKEEVVQHLHRDILGNAIQWKGQPSKITTREARWGKHGSFSLILKGPNAGTWCDFEQGDKGRDLFSLYITTYGLGFKEGIIELAKTCGLDLNNSHKRSSVEIASIKKEQHAIEIHRQQKVKNAQQEYSKGVPIQGTLAEKYLQNRELKAPEDFRFREKMKHPDTGKPTPALIAPIRSKDNSIQGIVRIFLNKEGGKLDETYINALGIENKAVNKANLGPLTGGAVVVNQGQLSGTVYLAEGIETALSIAAVRPLEIVMASLSASQLSQVPIPLGTNHITLCADNDGAHAQTYKAITKAVQRYSEQGFKVSIALPERLSSDQKIDFNDILKRSGSDKVHEILQKAVPITADQLVDKGSDLQQTLDDICVEPQRKIQILTNNQEKIL